MGSVCCIAARERDKKLPNRTAPNNMHGNARCSPTWSFCRENRRSVAGEIDDSPYQTSHGLSRDVSMEVKGPLGSDRGLAMESSYPVKVNKQAESLDNAELSPPKLSYPVHSPLSTPGADSLPVCGHPLHPNWNPSRRPCRSPGHPLLRQISDSRILGLKSPDNCSLSEGRPSFVLSTCSHDFAMDSQGWSSDGWSIRTFSEHVASSQREILSFDSEHFGYGLGKLSGCSSRFSSSPSIDLQTCGACSKFLTERSSWSSQRIISNNEMSVVAVLVCGHVYHTECLETMTLEVDKYDPACPICVGGEKHVSKMSRKALRGEADLKTRSRKISRNRVVDSYLDSDSDDLDCQKYARRGTPKIRPSYSGASSSTKPFLRRHFSFGSKWIRSLSENDCQEKRFLGKV